MGSNINRGPWSRHPPVALSPKKLSFCRIRRVLLQLNLGGRSLDENVSALWNRWDSDWRGVLPLPRMCGSAADIRRGWASPKARTRRDQFAVARARTEPVPHKSGVAAGCCAARLSNAATPGVQTKPSRPKSCGVGFLGRNHQTAAWCKNGSAFGTCATPSWFPDRTGPVVCTGHVA